MSTVDRSTRTTMVAPHRNGLFRVSGLASLGLGVLFLLAVVSLATAELLPGAAGGWLSPIQDNWLIVLLKLNAGFDGVSFDLLTGPNLLDVAILVLVGTTYLGLYAALRQTSKLWSAIAVAMPFLGIVVFVATRLSGRSGVMGGGLVMSLVILRSGVFGRAIAILGIVANVLLLVGDFGTTGGSSSVIVAITLAIGYVLLTVWFFLIGRRLLDLGQGAS
ncbi:MAG: hypothetical protein ACYC5O_08685 [Anaerolineae bacterium]